MTASCPRKKPRCAKSSPGCRSTGRCWSWSISPTRSEHYRWQWPALAEPRWPICRAWRCERQPTCTPVPPKPMRVMPSSSPIPPPAMPHTLRAVDRDSEVLSALKVLAGFDEDLAHETTRAINRLRSLLVQIYPSLERVFAGKTITRPIVLNLLIRYHGPAGLQKAGKSAVKRWARNHTRKDPSGLIDAIFTALGEQTVTVPGSVAAELVIPRVAGQIAE